MKKKVFQPAMTLIEVLVSVIILTIIIFSIAGAISLVFKANRYDGDLSASITFSQELLERIRSYATEATSAGFFDIFLYIPPVTSAPTYNFLAQDMKHLIYSVEYSPVPPGADPNSRLKDLKKVTVTVWYSASKTTPSPAGVKLYQISTFIKRRN